MTKGEINSLQTLARAGGGSLTINPHTGLAEAGFLSKLLPMAAGAAAMYFSGGTAAPLLGGLGMGLSSAGTIGLGLGALETARTGSLQKGLMAGLGAYSGAGLAGGLLTAGAQQVAGDTIAKEAATNAAAEGVALPSNYAQMAGQTATPAQLQTASQGMSGFDAMGKGVNAIQSGGFGAAKSAMQAAGGPSLGRVAFTTAAPMMMGGNQQPQTPVGDSTMPQRLKYNPGAATTTPMPDVPGYDNLGQDFGRQQSYFPNAGYEQITPEQAKQIRGYAEGGLNLSGEYSRDLNNDLENTYSRAERKNDKETMRSVKSEAALRERLKNPKMYAGGGPVEAMSNANAIGANTGYPMADINKATYATPYQTPISQNVVQGAADTGVNSMTGEINEFAAGGDVQLQGRVTIDDQGSQGGQFGKALDNGYRPMGGGGFGGASLIDQRVMNGGLREQGMTAGFGGQNGQANPFSDAMPQGMAQQNLQMAMQRGEAVPPANDPYATPLLRHCGIGMATGGTAYAQGGMSHLGDYSDGGRLLKGPGDGVSDSIPATIGNKRPARLADGEFVVPARIVSELGNGSTEAGARKLYAMLDRVQSARKKSIGKGKVAKNSRADKLLPA